jgi:hypothetical protein
MTPLFYFTPTGSGFFQSMFPLSATIFLFNKKQKGFPLQSGVSLQLLGIFQTFGLFRIVS